MARPKQKALVTLIIFSTIPCLNGAFSPSWPYFQSSNVYNNRDSQWNLHGSSQYVQNEAKQWRRSLATARSFSLSSILPLDSIQDSPWMPLYLSCIAGASTCLGAAIVFLRPQRKSIGPNALSFSLSLAASVMITVSVLSLGPECLRDVSIGEEEPYRLMPLWSGMFVQRLVSFGVGCFLYRLLSVYAFPQPEDLVVEALQSESSDENNKTNNDSTQLIVDHHQVKKHSSPSKQRQEQSMRSRKSSQLSTISSTKSQDSFDSTDEEKGELNEPLLQLEDANNDGYTKSPPSHSSTTSLSQWSSGNDLQTAQQRRSWRVVMLLFTSLLIHNFPEGLAVAASSVQSTKLGLAVTVGIMIHNIPEGICIAVPCLHARPDKPLLAFLLASGSGLAEPLGAAVALLVLRNSSFFPMENVLAFVAGIMVAVAVLELVPEARRHESKGYFAGGMLTGIVVMAATEFYLPS